jgi:hypothetical protein
LIVVGPVFVTVDAARTAKFPAVPSLSALGKTSRFVGLA